MSNNIENLNIEEIRQEAMELRRKYMSLFFKKMGKKLGSTFISELRVSKEKATTLKMA